jgi:cytochrome c oxidase cbb3-type subunit 3/ubiquinol-cytochrome c reductase cytochrome c subunit
MSPARLIAALLPALLLTVLATACSSPSNGDNTPPPGCPDVSYVGDGAPPTTFASSELLLGIDTIWPEYEAGAQFIFADARPTSDFALHTITGAISLPYYDVGDCLADLPMEAWYIFFCGCPHSLSSNAAEQLLAAGFENVKVLDEGYFEWRARGYPTTDIP